MEEEEGFPYEKKEKKNPRKHSKKKSSVIFDIWVVEKVYFPT